MSEYEKNEWYEYGKWDTFEIISAVIYGKQCYFKEDGGVIYSRISHTYLKDCDEAISEFLKWYKE